MSDYLTYLATSMLDAIGTTGSPWVQIVFVAMIAFIGVAAIAFAVDKIMDEFTEPEPKPKFVARRGTGIGG